MKQSFSSFKTDMSRLIDLTGQRFGRLTVIERDETIKNHIRWRCKCDCGKEIVAYKSSLDAGRTKSCGCLRASVAKAKATRHGKSESRLYNIWIGMKTRCYNEGSLRFRDYGGRGITMCDEWLYNFKAFYEWAISNGYREDLTIDRIDNDGNYEPSNCRWVGWTEQQNNRRNNHVISLLGETHTMKEWSVIVGIPYHTLARRINASGWSIERALTERVGGNHNSK